MRFGKVVEQTTWSFQSNVELSDPPIYSADRQFISSKDGMLWTRVAPHAAAPAIPSGAYGTSFTTSGCCPHIGGAAPAPGPFVTVTLGGSKSSSPQS